MGASLLSLAFALPPLRDGGFFASLTLALPPFRGFGH